MSGVRYESTVHWSLEVLTLEWCLGYLVLSGSRFMDVEMSDKERSVSLEFVLI